MCTKPMLRAVVVITGLECLFQNFNYRYTERAFLSLCFFRVFFIFTFVVVVVVVHGLKNL